MQVNIDRKSGILLGIIGLLTIALIVMAVSGFSKDSNNVRGSHDQKMGMDHSDHGKSAMDKSNTDQPGNEIMFYQMMIPHHQQAVDISLLALDKSKNSELLKLAQEIYDGQSSEIKLMNSWLGDDGMNHDMNHMMDGRMGGMLTDEELSTLKSKNGEAFDIYWLKRMIAHHEGALHMVLMIEDSSNSEVSKLASDIKEVQSGEITRMEKLLVSLGA